MSNQQRFAPDLVADKDIQRVDKLLPGLIVVGSVLLPAVDRRPGDLVLERRAVGVLLGRPGAHRVCCTT